MAARKTKKKSHTVKLSATRKQDGILFEFKADGYKKSISISKDFMLPVISFFREYGDAVESLDADKKITVTIKGV